jgi:hypothetical protein
MTRGPVSFNARRGVALAMVHLTRRDDLVVSENHDDSGPDLTVRISRGSAQPAPQFWVLVKAVVARLTPSSAANHITKSARMADRTTRQSIFPVVYFVFSMLNDDGFYAWAIEPIVEPTGRPRLCRPKTIECRKLDRSALNEIVTAIDRWYDALVQALHD